MYNNITGSPASGAATGWTVTSATQTFKPLTPGSYTIKWSYYDQTRTCPTVNLGNKPYLAVTGGDIVAGPGITSGASCTPATTAGIKGWNNYQLSAGANLYGAGSQLAAIALGNITGFASATNYTDGSTSSNIADTAANKGVKLTLANTGSGVVVAQATDSFGGGVGLNSWCFPDYATAAGAATATGPVDYTTPGTRVYSLSGTQTIAAPPIGNNVHITLVVTGDVYITTDILYAPYADVTNMPQFTLLVKNGSIFINNGVQELHGTYSAQKGATAGSGKIHTCTTSAAAPTSFSLANCSAPLTFYGAVSADELKLERTGGNVATPGASAENFVYSPEMWLSSSNANIKAGWQAVTSLAPVL